MKIVARGSDPQTSWDAASSVTKLREKQQAVLDVFYEHTDLTDEQLIDYYEIKVYAQAAPRQTESGIRTRRSELVRLGLVEWTGHKRRISTGREARVWARAVSK